MFEVFTTKVITQASQLCSSPFWAEKALSPHTNLSKAYDGSVKIERLIKLRNGHSGSTKKFSNHFPFPLF